ncbi:MAG: ferrochelatase [Nostocoides sp.]
MRGILLLSFGGPEAPDEVLPFLQRVTAGRGVPGERLRLVAGHYAARGGVSPINAENRRLIAALRAELDRRGHDVPIFWGNRHSRPYVDEALQEASRVGVSELTVILTSAYPSYSSCRQYREDLAAAQARTNLPVALTKVGPYALTPGFIEAATDVLTQALTKVSATASSSESGPRDLPYVLFVTHSIPEQMDLTSGTVPGRAYTSTHREVVQRVCSATARRVGAPVFGELVFCSRSGPPQQPWLGPDINDRLHELAADGIRAVAVHPIGFVSDHMEVVHDVDTEARNTAVDLGIDLVRVPTVGTHPAFVTQLVDLALTGPKFCPAGCCPNLRTDHDAACGED